jgi:hypothetical protein
MLREMLGAAEVRVRVCERMLLSTESIPELEEAGAAR